MQKEQLSAYIDGEQLDDETLNALHQSEELQQAWNHYHLIRSVMRQETQVILGNDFTAKMAELIEQESEHFVLEEQPTVQPQKPHWLSGLKKFSMPAAQFAIAASVCLVSVIGVQSFMQKQSDVNIAQESGLQTLPFTPSVQEVSYNAPSQEMATPEQLERQNKRLGIMLQDYELQRRISFESNSLEPAAPYSSSTVAQ